MRRFHQDVLSDASHRVVEGMSSYDFASVFKAAGVRVMYGEAKSHREVGFGSLALGTRENVIRIKEGREYI